MTSSPEGEGDKPQVDMIYFYRNRTQLTASTKHVNFTWRSFQVHNFFSPKHGVLKLGGGGGGWGSAAWELFPHNPVFLSESIPYLHYTSLQKQHSIDYIHKFFTEISVNDKYIQVEK